MQIDNSPRSVSEYIVEIQNFAYPRKDFPKLSFCNNSSWKWPVLPVFAFLFTPAERSRRSVHDSVDSVEHSRWLAWEQAMGGLEAVCGIGSKWFFWIAMMPSVVASLLLSSAYQAHAVLLSTSTKVHVRLAQTWTHSSPSWPARANKDCPATTSLHTTVPKKLYAQEPTFEP